MGSVRRLPTRATDLLPDPTRMRRRETASYSSRKMYGTFEVELGEGFLQALLLRGERRREAGDLKGGAERCGGEKGKERGGRGGKDERQKEEMRTGKSESNGNASWRGSSKGQGSGGVSGETTSFMGGDGCATETECILLWDEETQRFTLECLSATASFDPTVSKSSNDHNAGARVQTQLPSSPGRGSSTSLATSGQRQSPLGSGHQTSQKGQGQLQRPTADEDVTMDEAFDRELDEGFSELEADAADASLERDMTGAADSPPSRGSSTSPSKPRAEALHTASPREQIQAQQRANLQASASAKRKRGKADEGRRGTSGKKGRSSPPVAEGHSKSGRREGEGGRLALPRASSSSSSSPSLASKFFDSRPTSLGAKVSSAAGKSASMSPSSSSSLSDVQLSKARASSSPSSSQARSDLVKPDHADGGTKKVGTSVRSVEPVEPTPAQTTAETKVRPDEGKTNPASKASHDGLRRSETVTSPTLNADQVRRARVSTPAALSGGGGSRPCSTDSSPRTDKGNNGGGGSGGSSAIKPLSALAAEARARPRTGSPRPTGGPAAVPASASPAGIGSVHTPTSSPNPSATTPPVPSFSPLPPPAAHFPPITRPKPRVSRPASDRSSSSSSDDSDDEEGESEESESGEDGGSEDDLDDFAADLERDLSPTDEAKEAQPRRRRGTVKGEKGGGGRR